jgi:hypothetical protein
MWYRNKDIKGEIKKRITDKVLQDSGSPDATVWE